MTILVLQTFTVESRAAGGAAEQKTPAQHVAAAPDHVADALKTEYRVENIERNSRDTVHGVGSPGGQK